MRLNICLVNKVQAVLVAEVIPLWCIRIVASTHCVDVKLLHYTDVLNHTLASHHIALQWVHLVAVYALDKHRLTIDEQLRVLNLRCAETYALGVCLCGLLAVAYAYHNLIEVWLLG